MPNFDDYPSFKEWLQALDDNERIDSELNDVLVQEIQEEEYNNLINLEMI